MKRIKTGLIGGGPGSFIGSIHYRVIMLDGLYELVCGAFSSDQAKSLAAGKDYHISQDRSYPTWEKMFETEAATAADQRMEAVIIATPNHLHFPQAMMALNKGFHVICDKPVTISSNEALQLARKIDESKLVFGLTHTYTGYPMVKEAQHLIKSGVLGSIRKVVVAYQQGWLSESIEQAGNKQAAWRTNPVLAGPGGCLGDIGVHASNLAEYITGQQITEVCADITSFVEGRQLDDDASVLLRFNEGAKGLLYASQISVGEENDLRINVYGEKGGLSWQQQEPNTLLLKLSGQPIKILKAGSNNLYLSERTRWNTRLPGGHPEGYIEAFANIYRNIACDINSKKSNTFAKPDFVEYPGIQDGVRGMLFIEKTIESANSIQKWIKF